MLNHWMKINVNQVKLDLTVFLCHRQYILPTACEYMLTFKNLVRSSKKCFIREMYAALI